MVEHLSTTLAEKLVMSGVAISISVDVVADPICVNSYLCHRQIERSVAECASESSFTEESRSLDQIRLQGFPIVAEIRHYPYLLDPLLAEDSSISLRELIKLNYGDTTDAFIGETVELGIECGIVSDTLSPLAPAGCLKHADQSKLRLGCTSPPVDRCASNTHVCGTTVRARCSISSPTTTL